MLRPPSTMPAPPDRPVTGAGRASSGAVGGCLPGGRAARSRSRLRAHRSPVRSEHGRHRSTPVAARRPSPLPVPRAEPSVRTAVVGAGTAQRVLRGRCVRARSCIIVALLARRAQQHREPGSRRAPRGAAIPHSQGRSTRRSRPSAARRFARVHPGPPGRTPSRALPRAPHRARRAPPASSGVAPGGSDPHAARRPSSDLPRSGVRGHGRPEPGRAHLRSHRRRRRDHSDRAGPPYRRLANARALPRTKDATGRQRGRRSRRTRGSTLRRTPPPLGRSAHDAPRPRLTGRSPAALRPRR